MMQTKIRYRGRIAQVGIYLGKLLRMFVYQSDWKALPMAALIAGLVTFAVGNNLYVSQEGTVQGCFALTCVCVWNGFFNSIQSICRERPIIKREHRSGMYISSYVVAHMIYQMLLCAAQTAITIAVCNLAEVKFPEEGLVTGSFMLDMAISLFLTTYAADMLSLAISALVHNTTTAMTVMPFMLIFQLLFSGGLINLTGVGKRITDFTIARWGLRSFCTLGNYNSRQMVTLWNTIFKFRDVEIYGEKPVAYILDQVQDRGLMDIFLQKCSEYNQNPDYVYTTANVLLCWRNLCIMTVVFALAAIILLEFIDRDKR